jgi:hypothetical protein
MEVDLQKLAHHQKQQVAPGQALDLIAELEPVEEDLASDARNQ